MDHNHDSAVPSIAFHAISLPDRCDRAIHPGETDLGTGRTGRDWLPLGITLFGIVFYTAISLWMEVKPTDLIQDTGLKSTETVIGETGALFHFRAVAVLSVISAFASGMVTIFLMIRYLTLPQAKFHLSILVILMVTAIAVNVVASSGATDQLLHLICSGPYNHLGAAFHFCESPTVIGPWIDAGLPGHKALNFRQLVNLPMAAAAACIAYSAFTLANETPVDKDGAAAREKIIALIMAFGGLMLALVTLLDREYARWALSGSIKNDYTTALVDGLTFFFGATSSALLAMIWLFAVGLLIMRRDDREGVNLAQLFSRDSSIFGILSVIAPIILALFEKLF